jgi:cytochrome c553
MDGCGGIPIGIDSVPTRGGRILDASLGSLRCHSRSIEPFSGWSMRFPGIIIALLLALGWLWMIAVPSALGDELPLFETTVLPVLVQKCGKCHSAETRKGDLSLATIAGLRQGGESGEPLLGATLEESHLWGMLDGGGMPPEGEPPLSAAERESIRTWILSGAKSSSVITSAEKPLTQHDVLPIVLLRCATCHGRQRQLGGVDLRTIEGMHLGGASGPALVAGDPDASLMLQRVESGACPPADQLLKFFVKRPPRSEVQLLRDWIAAGAPVAEIAPDVATTEPDPLVTDDDRQHWAFQPPRKTPGFDSIDQFIAAKLGEHGLAFSPEADRDVLIRRAHLDLLGLPPSREDWRRWHVSFDPDWYARMIDELLASPHYGERWGRYWLDVAGYADSEGGISDDPLREVAWKYRDYVVRSLNADKPYDRFLLEQIAGDELIDVEQADAVTEEMVDHLVATGFLRMGIDQTGSRTMNFVPERLGVINDAITVLGSGVMGLTLECARCHSHKYDAIPQRDYYRLKAIFQGALDEHDWLTFKNRELDLATVERRAEVAAVNPPLQKELKRTETELRQAITAAQTAVLRHHYPDQSEADRIETLAALKIADNNRTLPQRVLVEMLLQADVRPDAEQSGEVHAARGRVRKLEAKLIDLQRRMSPPLAIRALWDRGEPSPTYILQRGEHERPGRLVGPGVPSVLTDGRTPFIAEPPFPEGTPKTGRRLAFARWLTRSDHPLTARVLVNRVWHHHFGAGLVRSLENFGVKGDPPSHPELLDWLAVDFMDRGWSLKELHRWIMNSRTYRQSSRIMEEHLAFDPQNRWLSRMPLRRMDAETLRDSLLFVAGRLDAAPGGPPDPVQIDREGQVSIVPTPGGGWRRSIYVQCRRTEIPTMLETFDYPEMGPNCVNRSVSTVSPQSLLLLNNEQVRELARALQQRATGFVRERSDGNRDPAASAAAHVEALYQIVLNREATAVERDLGANALARLAEEWGGDSAAALESYCHTLLNSAAFLYVD